MIWYQRLGVFSSRSSKEAGFALPTILIASIVMIMVLLSAVQTAVSIRTALDNQYYNKVTQEAAESGAAMARECLRQSGYEPQWTSVLRPNTDCTGAVIAGLPEYVVQTATVRATFAVTAPESGAGQQVTFRVNGTLDQLRRSTNTPWKTFTTTLAQAGSYRDKPQISGGAGYQAAGHFGLLTTSSGQLYGFGANDGGQLTSTASPANVSTPIKVDLPAGVNKVTKITTSGYGATLVCIIGDNLQAYCRGDQLLGYTQWGLVPNAWNRVNVPTGLNVYSISVNGYGVDVGCVRAGTNQTSTQAYCWGSNNRGVLGAGIPESSLSSTPISSPRQFVGLGSGRTAKLVATQGQHTCVINDQDDLFCAGSNNRGQTTGPVAGEQSTPSKFNIPNMGSVVRKAKSVIMSYHYESRISVLATDGSIWSAGAYDAGDLGNWTVSGDTGTNSPGRAPVWFGYAGGRLLAQEYSQNHGIPPHIGKCIDLNGTTSGSAVVTGDCNGLNGSANQQFFFTEDGNIFHQPSGLCVSVSGGSSNPANTAAVVLLGCSTGAGQRFTRLPTGQIKQTSSDKCLNMESATVGTQVRLRFCSPVLATQKFFIDGRALPFKGMISMVRTLCGAKSIYVVDNVRSVSDTSGLWCAGENRFGQFGNVATNFGNYQHGEPCVAENNGAVVRNSQIINGIDVDKLNASGEWQYQYDSLMAISLDGRVYGAGRDEYGKLGSGTLGDAANDYRQCQLVEFRLPSGVKAVDMSTRDEYTTYVLGDNGRVYAAGRGNNGQRGDASIESSRTNPVEVLLPREDLLY